MQRQILDSGCGFEIVVGDIAEGEEATYDYRLFHDAEELAFQPLCGDQACHKAARRIHHLSEELNFWNVKISSARESMSDVYQPLSGKLPD